MKRLIIGLGALFFTLATVVVVVPFLLPKDAIKAQVVAEVEKASGWRLRLDGPVSLSLVPGFSLIANNVGLSGEAGADGIEFAKAGQIEFGLGWAGLLGGDIHVTGVTLTDPVILMEIGPSGLTSWAPRRRLTDDPGNRPSTEQTADSSDAGETPGSDGNAADTASARYLERVGIDRLTIANGRLIYSDKRGGAHHEVSELDLTVAAPSLRGDATLTASFVWQGHPFAVSGLVTDPISFAEGAVVPIEIAAGSGDAEFAAKGTAGLAPLRLEIDLQAGGPSLQAVAALANAELAVDPGAFSLSGRVAGSNAAFSFADLVATLGTLTLNGTVDADLAGTVPAYSGRIVLKDGALGDLLALAGQNHPANGTLGTDIAFQASGDSTAMVLATLDVRGEVTISDGSIDGLGLAAAVGNDPAADRIENINLAVNLTGLSNPVDLSGALSWRGEGFTVTGTATPAPMLAGLAAPVTTRVKSNRVSFGFEGEASGAGGLDGAITVETADLRGLLAWMGQPIAAGGGLKTFKAAGLFTAEPNAIAFEETSFTLDETSGQAQGRVSFAGKPDLRGELTLSKLVLDPYLGSAGNGQGGGKAATNTGAAAGDAAGWSSAPIDFSGLQAANVNFKVSAREIHWDKILIGDSALTTVIKDGVLTATLDRLALYEGSGTGAVVLNGAASVPTVKARFALDGLRGYPALRDAADFEWIEGIAAANLDVSASGASERQLVESLGGTARFEFADGAIRGINIPKMVRSLSIETLLGWQASGNETTDFSSLGASFQIARGVATSSDLSMVGPLIRMNGKGTTDLPARTLDWRVEPLIVPTLEGQAPVPRAKGTDKQLAGLGVPIVINGSWDKPNIYPDIAGILKDPAAAYKQLRSMGGSLVEILNKKPDEALVETANEVIRRATGGNTQIDVQKVIDGNVDDQEVLKAVEDGFGLPAGLLGQFGLGKKKSGDLPAQ